MPEADRTFARSLDTWFHKSITYRYIYTYIYYNVLNDIDTRLLKEESPQIMMFREELVLLLLRSIRQRYLCAVPIVSLNIKCILVQRRDANKKEESCIFIMLMIIFSQCVHTS